MVFKGLPYKVGGLLVFAAHFRMRRRQEVAASSNGEDAVLSRLRWEFDSPRCYQRVCVLERSEWRCDAGSFNGRTRVFEARYERSIRSPAAKYVLNRSSRSGEGYGYFSFQENTVSDCSLLTLRGHSTG